MQLPLSGDLLHFDRTGSYLVVADGEAVSIVHGVADAPLADRARRTVHVNRHRVRAVAAFDDQIWLVDGSALHRHDLDGRTLGEALELPDDAGAAWSLAPCGPAGVVW